MKVEAIPIAFCENGAGYGGAIISLEAFLGEISADFAPYIYTGIGVDAYQKLARFGNWKHIPAVSLVSQKWLRTHYIPLASTLDNLFNLIPTALSYYFSFKHDGIKLVYLNNDTSCNMAAAMAGRWAGIPIILHARGFNAATKGNLWVLDQLQHCIAVSKAVKAELVGLGFSSEKCTVVPEGLDTELFHPKQPSRVLREELGLLGSEPVITLVGGLIDWKGQDTLLDAVPRILERFPDSKFLLVGNAYGKDNHFADLIATRASSLEFKGSVRLLGSRNDVPDILSISTIVLHASTKPEPFGRTFLEGMAMGKPVIASNEGGPLDVIDDGVNGLLITPRAPEILAAAIIRLLSDKSLSKKLGENAAKKALSYSIQNHVKSISLVLRNILINNNIVY